jgi:hypothetical protein
MTDVGTNFVFIGKHDANGAPLTAAEDSINGYLNNRLEFDTHPGSVSDVMVTTAATSTVNAWNSMCPNDVDATNSVNNANFSTVQTRITQDANMLEYPSKYSGNNTTRWLPDQKSLMVCRLLAKDCGYNNMIGFTYKNVNYIVYPNVTATMNKVAALSQSTCFMLCFPQWTTPVSNSASANDTHSTYQYLTVNPNPTNANYRAPVFLFPQGFDTEPINFFIVNDGWTKWVNGETITTDHLYYASNTNGTYGSDAGHAVNIARSYNNAVGDSNPPTTQ